MTKYRFFLGAGAFLIVVFCFVLSLRIEFPETPATPQLKDWTELDWAAESLREYAKTHNGQYPQLNMPILADGLSVKGVLVVSNLPVVNYFPHDRGNRRPYPFLYFPIDTPANKALPLFEPNNLENLEGLRQKVLAASINVFVPPNGGSPYRIVADYYAGSGPMDESEFQKFLNLGTSAPTALQNGRK